MSTTTQPWGATMSEADLENKRDADAVTSVASAVLGSFFDELQQTEDLKDISENLRKLILTDGVMAEAAIRNVLFPEGK